MYLDKYISILRMDLKASSIISLKVKLFYHFKNIGQLLNKDSVKYSMELNLNIRLSNII